MPTPWRIMFQLNIPSALWPRTLLLTYSGGRPSSLPASPVALLGFGPFRRPLSQWRNLRTRRSS